MFSNEQVPSGNTREFIKLLENPKSLTSYNVISYIYDMSVNAAKAEKIVKMVYG